MKASELITQLQWNIDNCGDLPVKIFQNHPIDGIYDGHYEIKSAMSWKCPWNIEGYFIKLETTQKDENDSERLQSIHGAVG